MGSPKRRKLPSNTKHTTAKKAPKSTEDEAFEEALKECRRESWAAWCMPNGITLCFVVACLGFTAFRMSQAFGLLDSFQGDGRKEARSAGSGGARADYGSGDWSDDDGGWLKDPREEELLADGSPCSIDRVDAHYLTKVDFEKIYRGKRPVFIRGLIDDWPAQKTWRRAELQRRLGERPTAAGDGANIVQSGGRRGKDLRTLSEYLAEMARLTTGTERRRPRRRHRLSEHRRDAPDTGVSNEPWEEEEEEVADLFNFDYNFAETMPELLEDFKTPGMFEPWARPTHAGGRSMSILSLGASRTGLPFHVHGETWLGLVFGKKRWFVFPPGCDVPPAILFPSSSSSSSAAAPSSSSSSSENGASMSSLVEEEEKEVEHNGTSDGSDDGAPVLSTLEQPLMGAYEWFSNVYPKVLSEYARLGHDKFFEGPPPSAPNPAARRAQRKRAAKSRRRKRAAKKTGVANGEAGEEEEEEEEEHLPSLLMCTQTSGEVLYLPAGWKHLTVNVGEAIGVGGQAPYDEERRLADALAALEEHPNDLLSLKSAALGFAHKGMALAEAQQQRQQQPQQPQQQQEAKEDKNPMHFIGSALEFLGRAGHLSPAHPEVAMLSAELLHFVGTRAAREQAKRTIVDCASHYKTTVTATNESSSISSSSSSSSSSRDRRKRSSAAWGLSRAKLASVHLNFARGFMSISEPALAIEELDTALALQPRLAGAHHTKGHALAMVGEEAAALESLTAALEYSQGDPEIRSHQAALERRVAASALSQTAPMAQSTKETEAPAAKKKSRKKKKKAGEKTDQKQKEL